MYGVSPDLLDLQKDVPNRAAFASAVLNPAVAGTAEQGPDQAIPAGFCLIVKANPANTGDVWVGESKAQAESHLFTLQPGPFVSLCVANATAIWIDVAVNAEGVEMIVEV